MKLKDIFFFMMFLLSGNMAAQGLADNVNHYLKFNEETGDFMDSALPSNKCILLDTLHAYPDHYNDAERGYVARFTQNKGVGQNRIRPLQLNDIIGNKARSISFWFRIDQKNNDGALQNNAQLVLFGGDGKPANPEVIGKVVINLINGNIFRIMTGGTKYGIDFCQKTDLRGEWHHIVLTIEDGGKGSDMRCYLDGKELTDRQLFGGDFILNTYSTLVFGHCFNGSISEFILFNKKVNEDQVMKLYDDTWKDEPTADEILWMPAIFNENMVIQRDKEFKVWGHALPGKLVSIKLNETAYDVIADENGEWSVYLPAISGGFETHRMVVSSGNITKSFENILFGDVFLAGGQSNMYYQFYQLSDASYLEEAKLDANYPNIRLHYVPNVAAGSFVDYNKSEVPWQKCNAENISKWSAVAFYFARNIHKRHNVPVGIISVAHGASKCDTWISPEAYSSNPLLNSVKVPHLTDEAQGVINNASSLFNLMLSKVLSYTLKGFIWYQGESNAQYAEQYEIVFPALIADWRKQWNDESLPFLFVQLSAYDFPHDPTNVSWGRLREAQYYTWRTVPNTGMVVTIDKGEEKNIHPSDKKTVGNRLAQMADQIIYGEKKVYSGPIFREAKVEGASMRINFYFAMNGLFCPNTQISAFEVCGADGIYHPAKAIIEGESVVVWADAVVSPASVRYGYKNWCEPNLYNKEGLPCVPFRTNPKEDNSTFKQKVFLYEMTPFTTSSEGENFLPENAINGSGTLAGNKHVSTVKNTSWISHASAMGKGFYKIRFNEPKCLDTMYINNLNVNPGDGRIDYALKDIAIFYATTDEDLSSVDFSDSRWKLMEERTLEKPNNSSSWPADTFEFPSENIPICWMGINVKNNYGGNAIGISEISFLKPRQAEETDNRFEIELLPDDNTHTQIEDGVVGIQSDWFIIDGILQNKNSEIGACSLTDVKGCIFIKNRSLPIDLNTVPNGVYLVIPQNRHFHRICKIVKR